MSYAGSVILMLSIIFRGVMAEVYNENQEKKALNKKTVILIAAAVLAVLVLAVGGFFGYRAYKKTKVASVTDPNVVATINGENIYLKDFKARLFAAEGGIGTPVQPFIGKSTKGIEESVLNDLVDLKIIDKQLAKDNIVISDSELAAEAKKIFKDYDQRDAIAQKAYRDYVSLQAGKNKLITNDTSWKEGYVLFCLFNRSQMSDKISQPNNAQMFAQDKDYAKDYCTKAEDRLKAGQSSFQDELAKVTADPRLGESAWKPEVMSYGLEINQDTLLHDPAPEYDLRNVLFSLSNDSNKFYLLTLKEHVSKTSTFNDGGVKLSEPTGNQNTTGRVSQKPNSSQQSQGGQDISYAVAYVKDGHTGEIKDFNEWLKNKYQEYHVKLYIERVRL